MVHPALDSATMENIQNHFRKIRQSGTDALLQLLHLHKELIEHVFKLKTLCVCFNYHHLGTVGMNIFSL